jgi:hypothetical protein
MHSGFCRCAFVFSKACDSLSADSIVTNRHLLFGREHSIQLNIFYFAAFALFEIFGVFKKGVVFILQENKRSLKDL